MAPLHGLLESDTAQRFKDEFVDIEMDARHVLWIITANDASKIPSTILSRMEVYEIPLPNKEQMVVIAKNIYTEILQEHPAWNFDPEPSAAVIDKLISRSPREIKQALKDAFPYAFTAGRTGLSPDDIQFKKLKEKRPIGFTN
jgi:ATP-dependent Lon protease